MEGLGEVEVGKLAARWAKFDVKGAGEGEVAGDDEGERETTKGALEDAGLGLCILEGEEGEGE